MTVDLEGSTYPSDGFGGSVQITDPEQVAQITALHQAIVAARSREDSIYDDSFYISLSYTLSNGQSIRRYYHGVPLYRAEQGMEGTVTWALDQLVSDRSFVRAGYGLDQSADWSLTEAYVYDLWDIQTQSPRVCLPLRRPGGAAVAGRADRFRRGHHRHPLPF